MTNLKKRQIVIMDNASIHKSKEVRTLIEKAECRLIYQPPYSPDLNPIEHFWSWIKGKIRSSKLLPLADAIQYALL
ncbi:MAG: transposase [Holosporaceae bacterium]|nr:transposase [Holosporaceae bacterium]